VPAETEFLVATPYLGGILQTIFKHTAGSFSKKSKKHLFFQKNGYFAPLLQPKRGKNH
jgi:hypothetical protein